MTIGSGTSSNAPGTSPSPRNSLSRARRRVVAPRAADGRGQFGGGGPHRGGTSAGDLEAAATRREARGAAPAGVDLLQTSGFRLSGERLPDGHAKLQILRAIDRARECIPLRAVLRFLRVSPSRFQAWRRRLTACALDDQSSCPRTLPHRLTLSEVKAIGDMVTSPEYRHVPTGALAVLAQRLGTVTASPSTWYRLVRKYGWRRPRLRVHPAKPKVGLRTTGADEMWHIDTSVIRITSVRISACTPGRRVRRVHFRLISSRCQRRIVSGVTMVARWRSARRPTWWNGTASRRRWSSVKRIGGRVAAPSEPDSLRAGTQ